MLIRQYDYDELVTYLEDRLSNYIPAQDIYPLPDGVPRRVFDYFPAVFGGKFPALAVSELPSEDGLPEIKDELTQDMPGVIVMGLRIYEVSLTRRGNNEIRDGRAQANRITRKIHSEWRKRFFADHDLLDRAGGNVSITRREMGDQDRLGTYFTEEATKTGSQRILWVHSSEIRFDFT